MLADGPSAIKQIKLGSSASPQNAKFECDRLRAHLDKSVGSDRPLKVQSLSKRSVKPNTNVAECFYLEPLAGLTSARTQCQCFDWVLGTCMS